MSAVKKPVIIKGKLKFKGSGGGGSSSSGTKRKLEEEPTKKKDSTLAEPVSEVEQLLTETQRKHMKRKLADESRTLKKEVAISYREKIETLNAKLSTLTEHNDLPRISAAGNG